MISAYITALLTGLMTLGLTPVQAQVYAALAEVGRQSEWPCIAEIYEAESSWNPRAIGDRHLGNSYGLPQRHAPAHGAPPWPWPVYQQVMWTLDYVDGRYGGACEALEFREENGWY